MKGKDEALDKEDEFLEKEFDFSKAIKNPYVRTIKKPITINLDESVVVYFKKESDNVGIPYQTLINMYLKDCMANERHLSWK